LLVLFLAVLTGLTVFYLPYRQQEMAARLPFIHDITTNIDNHPTLVAIDHQFKVAPNPMEYVVGE
jgi:hypothetical protein